MTKPNENQKLDMLSEEELAPLVACDAALRAAKVKLDESRNQVKELNRQIAESVDLDVSALREGLVAPMTALSALPLEIGALKRRLVLLHLGGLKVQRDRKKVVVDSLGAELAELQGKMRQISKETQAIIIPTQWTPEEKEREQARHTALHLALREYNAPEQALLIAYNKAKGQVGACDSWARDLGVVAEGGYPGEPRKEVEVALDRESTWGPAALAQGEAAQREAARW